MAGGGIAVRLFGFAFNFGFGLDLGFVFGFAFGFCCGFAELVRADTQTGRLFRQTGRQADRGTDGHKDGRPRNGWSEGLRTDDGQNDNERQDGQGFMTRRSVRSLTTPSASFHRYC